MRIVVAGAGGQLGAAVVRECAAAHDVVPLARADLDIADDRAVAASIDPLRPTRSSTAPPTTASTTRRITRSTC